MKRRLAMVGSRCAAVAGLVAVCALPSAASAQADAGFRPAGPWVTEVDARASNDGGVLFVRSGAIRTARLYTDYVLRFEFRLPEPDARGFVLVRSRMGYGKDPTDLRAYRVALTSKTVGKDAAGRVSAVGARMQELSFDALPAASLASGEWHACEVRAERDLVTVLLNGAVVSTVRTLDESVGYIGLQSGGGGGLQVRNPQAKRLPQAQEPFGGNAYVTVGDGVVTPRVVKEVRPFYPREPHAQRLEGTVKLDLIVETTGLVGDIRVVGPLHPDLDEAAIGAARQWRFTPGTRDGQPVPVIVTLEITFSLER